KTRVLLAALLVFGLPAGAVAQVTGTVSVDGHGGLSFPLGTLGDLTSTGGAFGGGLAVHFHPNWAVRGDATFIMLDNKFSEDATPTLLSPPVDLLYLGGGLEVNFTAPLYQDLPLTFAANLGAGVTSFDVDETWQSGHPANDIDGSYLTFTGGGQLGLTVYRGSSLDANLFVKAQPYFILTDSSDMEGYEASLLELEEEPFDYVWVLPLTGGVRLTF
ncbi:MAG: hypothetical protein ACODAB_09375, partial [Gemmatimonadota bacterium]